MFFESPSRFYGRIFIVILIEIWIFLNNSDQKSYLLHLLSIHFLIRILYRKTVEEFSMNLRWLLLITYLINFVIWIDFFTYFCIVFLYQVLFHPRIQSNHIFSPFDLQTYKPKHLHHKIHSRAIVLKNDWKVNSPHFFTKYEFWMQFFTNFSTNQIDLKIKQ